MAADCQASLAPNVLTATAVIHTHAFSTSCVQTLYSGRWNCVQVGVDNVLLYVPGQTRGYQAGETSCHVARDTADPRISKKVTTVPHTAKKSNSVGHVDHRKCDGVVCNPHPSPCVVWYWAQCSGEWPPEAATRGGGRGWGGHGP